MSESEARTSERSEPNELLGVALVAVGLIVVVAGLFLPRGVAEEPDYELFDNTLIGGPAVLFGIGIAAILVLLWRWWSYGDVSWIALLAFALVGVVYSVMLVWLVAADLVWTDLADREIATRPGAGSWAVLVGSLVVTGGVLVMRTAEPARRARVRKPPTVVPGAAQQPWGAAPAAPQPWGGQPQQPWGAQQPQQPWGAPAAQHQQQPWGAPAAASQHHQATQLPPPGWYPDPQPRSGFAAELRWWDGRQWTEDRRPVPAGGQPAPPQPAPPQPQQPAPPRPGGPESPGSLWSGPRDDYR